MKLSMLNSGPAREIRSLLLMFHADWVKEDLEKYGSFQGVIANQMINEDKESVARTLKEGHELLAMEPFPWQWVEDLMYSAPYNPDTKNWIDCPDKECAAAYKKYVAFLLDLFEKEAKKQGKLCI